MPFSKFITEAREKSAPTGTFWGYVRLRHQESSQTTTLPNAQSLIFKVRVLPSRD